MRLRGKDECRAVPVVIEGLAAHAVPCAECLPIAPIPDDEREIALDMGYAVPPPCFVGFQHQFGIRAVAQPGAIPQQLSTQFFPVVDATVHDKHQALVFVAEGLFLLKGFRRGAQHALAEGHRTLDPMVDAVRPAIGHRGSHFFH